IRMKPASATRSGEYPSIAASSAASNAPREENSRSSTTCAGMPDCAANFRPGASGRLLITAATFAGSPAPTIASMLLPRPEIRMTMFFTQLFYRSDSSIRFLPRRSISLLLPCSRGSGLRESRQRLQAVRFEQLLQLRRRFPGSLDELRLVVLDRVLRFEPLFVVLLEQAHGTLGGGDAETQGKQRVARHVEARRKGLAPDELDAQVPQAKQVHAVARAGEDRNLREVLAHDCRSFRRSLDVVDRQHEELRLARLRRLEQLEARSVAVIDLAAEAPHEIHLLVARFERRERHAAHAQHARDDMPYAAVAGDDDRVSRSRDRIELRRRVPLGPARECALVSFERERREQHRYGHDHDEELRGARLEYAEAPGRDEQNEGELATLRNRNCKSLRGVVRRAADPGDRVHQCKLYEHEAEYEAEHRERPFPNEAKVRAHAHGYEEKTEQQALEGLDVGLQLVAKFGIGEEHPGEEGAERGRQADFLHDERGAHHEQQRRRGKYLATAVARRRLQHRTHDEPA